MTGWADATEPSGTERAFATLEDFVDEWLAPTYRRDIDGPSRAWCPEWWRHPEAVSRLEGLWRAYEHLHAQMDTGLSVFWRDHADPCMDRLLDEHGAFAKCRRGVHSDRLEPLPLASRPAAAATSREQA